MILTIVGANFEGANIGQNKSVTITLNKTGANGSKSSVTLEKDKSVSSVTVIATGLSLKTGYENLVVTVTMAGTGDVSSWYSNGTVTIPSGTTITGNITITATATKTTTGGGEVVDPEEPGTGGETVLLIDNLTDLSTLKGSQYGPTQGKNGSSFIERTNIATGKFIEYIDLYAIQPNKTLPNESVDIADLKIYFVDSSTDTVKEMVFDESNYSSQNIDGVQIFRCNINKPQHTQQI